MRTCRRALPRFVLAISKRRAARFFRVAGEGFAEDLQGLLDGVTATSSDSGRLAARYVPE